MADSSNSETASDAGSDVSSRAASWDCLTRCLDNIESAGDFATVKRYQLAPNPALQVDDDMIPLPLQGRDAQSIKQLARQAPFGKGNQTIIDVDVRQTWELSTDRFRLQNPAWPDFLNTVLRDVCVDLGIIGSVEARPHKLLLYEKDSFFKPHKDSQKEGGMIATLAVCLPAEHEGGDVHLSHAGQRKTFASDSSVFDITALAWFSDVTHEVRRVVSGHRLVLTYNVIHKSGLAMSAGAFEQQLDTVNGALAACRLNGFDVARKIYPLDHQYSRAGLSLHVLKGRDRAVCEILHKLCSRHGFFLLLAHLTRTYSSYPDQYGEDESETVLSLDVINRPNGSRIARQISFNEDQLLNDPYDERAEDSFEASEHLGNEESPEIFKYYDSAAVICPKIHLRSYLRLSSNIDLTQMMLMVMQDHDGNLDAAEPPHDSLAVLKGIVNSRPEATSPGIYSTTIKWAWEHEYQDLYSSSVFSAIDDTYPSSDAMNTVAAIINANVSNAEDTSAIEWDKYFGNEIARVHNLSSLAENLNMVLAAIVDRLKPAFIEWKTTAGQKLFDSKESIENCDKDFIKSKWESSDWFTNSLVPTLGTRGRRGLITSLVTDLLEHQSKVNKTQATDNARKILESTYSKIALDPTDFTGSNFSYAPAFGLLKLCLAHGLRPIANQILDATWAKVNAYHKSKDSTSLRSQDTVKSNLYELCSLLQDFKVPYRRSTRQLFTLLIRRYLYLNVPSYPEERPGWSYKNRGCTSYCEECSTVNKFIRDEDAIKHTFEFRDWERFARHARALPSSVYCIHSDEQSKTVEVTKIAGGGFEEDLDDYRPQVAKFEEYFRRLRCDYIKELLRDADYRELVMLEGVKLSEGAEQLARERGEGKEEVTQAGTVVTRSMKTKANEALVEPTAKKARRR
ncbi:hypothetical protein F4802DRAFT_574226 [Xylaria palmicola]|nr:hypothetical protein F4802DRAFT_574226 [Xylaria palmicola]